MSQHQRGATETQQEMSLLSVRDLTVEFETDRGPLRAVDGVDFDVERGETVCLVGESGSGKTVTAETITKLIRMPPGRIVRGVAELDGRDLLSLSERDLRAIRGDRIAHVFQDPQHALNHCYTVGWQIREAIQVHEDVSDAAARERALTLLDQVGIPDATTRYDDYPHEFSGGMKQRIVVAMALAATPDLLIADEPTTALDVTIQAQLLDLLESIQTEYDMAILLITHDLGVVAELADRVVVLYAGKVMERGSVYDVFDTPAHPYTQVLFDCLPGRGRPLRSIGGTLPDLHDPPPGCRFASRCEYARNECHTGDQPPLYDVADAQTASCVYYGPGGDPDALRNGQSEGDPDG
ncbi:ABC transporter ATP-binding protein [Halomicroarcula sp. S1AR25-4]|uniref:ABC transporter ATP-binding protein n=1 Tax=Haloarcula sp. S1AR25-4 TaxID=2950538 RepID=UPI0028751A9B|nr:ABC transporter ATP-binding protein [Halomicroarcula sp. S1AR25-4]MDS0279611.1 ABC transporter ATP-binding protein [Halomicroarcula sp. S1AR25-4]